MVHRASEWLRLNHFLSYFNKAIKLSWYKFDVKTAFLHCNNDNFIYFFSLDLLCEEHKLHTNLLMNSLVCVNQVCFMLQTFCRPRCVKNDQCPRITLKPFVQACHRTIPDIEDHLPWCKKTSNTLLVIRGC